MRYLNFKVLIENSIQFQVGIYMLIFLLHTRRVKSERFNGEMIN